MCRGRTESIAKAMERGVCGNLGKATSHTQVAETFDMDTSGDSLKDVARLDTCVTVIDASNLKLNLSSIKKVKVGFPPVVEAIGQMSEIS